MFGNYNLMRLLKFSVYQARTWTLPNFPLESVRTKNELLATQYINKCGKDKGLGKESKDTLWNYPQRLQRGANIDLMLQNYCRLEHWLSTLDQYWSSVVYQGHNSKLSTRHCTKVETKVPYDFKILPICALRWLLIEKVCNI